MSGVTDRLPLGERLLACGMITTDQLEIALIEQRKHGLLLGQQLVRLNFVSDALVRDLLAQQHAQQTVDLTQSIPDPELRSHVPEAFARQYKLLPLQLDPEKTILQLAMVDIFNVVALDQLRVRLGPQVQLQPMLATEVQLEQALDRFYGHELSLQGILHEIETGELSASASYAGEQEYRRPVVRLIDAILLDAVKQHASDIHFEPAQAFLRIRYRMDGVLWQIRSLHQRYWPAMSVRLKIMSGMDIAEQRSAQDGRIQVYLCGRAVDFRVSTQPTLFGENIVLRVLDRDKASVSLAQLGIRERQVALLRSMLQRPEGMLIMTGPTGSGKTTTLYALLSYLNTLQVNIMTLEDPVEYPMPLMRQTSVNAANKVDFASGIRAILRQDPDIILVGEVRDEATAQMALRAAMTGHLVMTTLHTNSAAAAFARLQDLGLSPNLMAGNVIGVIGQRLVRRLCPRCKVRVSVDECGLDADFAAWTSDVAIPDHVHEVYRAVGCPHCRMSGYAGRVPIVEVLPMYAALDTLLLTQATPAALCQQAREHGYTPLAEEGMRLVLDGQTSMDELRRVVALGSMS